MTKMRFTEKGSNGWEDPETSQTAFPWPMEVQKKLSDLKRPAELLEEYQTEYANRLQTFIEEWEQQYGDQLESLEEGQYGPPVNVPLDLLQDSPFSQPEIHAAANTPSVVSPWTTSFVNDTQIAAAASSSSTTTSSLSSRTNASRASSNSSKRKTPLEEPSTGTSSGTPSKRSGKSSGKDSGNQSNLFAQLNTSGTPSHNYVVRVLQQRFAMAKTRRDAATPEFVRINAKRGCLRIHPDFMQPEQMTESQTPSQQSQDTEDEVENAENNADETTSSQSDDVSTPDEVGTENSTVKKESPKRNSKTDAGISVSIPSPPRGSHNGFMRSSRSTAVLQDVSSPSEEQTVQPIECPNVLQVLLSSMDMLLASGNSITSGNYLWENIYPQDKDTRVPVYNPQGKYLVKLFIHGNWRSVLVDDRIPVDDMGVPLLVFSSDISELWYGCGDEMCVDDHWW
eukprot:TRINITY_DN3106_c0_g2_i1.p1 TRINITY_DN3106_c0_g2~~TRINITY_DN3106_c0_g2_i1.p1  ORF type:complete len:496 (+),score=144.04 TRINITY_DN3106_c0_g2_i1:131-1489(+)